MPALLKAKKFLVLDLLVIFLLLLLPYYLFDGKFFIGGDDRRLYYSFPWEYLKNIAFYSWSNVASVGFHNPNQNQVPFLIAWIILEKITNNKVIISYLAFSLPLVVGFIYFKKFLAEFIDYIHPIQFYVATFFYILSPIISVIALSYFLTWAFLIGLIPIVCFYFIKYLKTSDKSYAFKNIFACILFSIASYSVPWILGFILPIFLGGLIGFFLYQKKQIFNFFKKFVFFFTLLGFSQFFWILPVLSMFLIKGNSFGKQINIISQSFSSTINATAIGTITYPLLNLFHRQIAMNFEWQVEQVFLNFYDKIFLLNAIFFIVVLVALYYFKNNTTRYERKILVLSLSSFLFSLYFFTVNIGILKDVFLLGRFLPFVVMFRNFYDKFALGFVFIYAVLLAICIGIIIKNFKRLKYYLAIVLLGIIFLNALPMKEVINNKLWKTKSTFKVITIPREYIDFITAVNDNVDPSTYVLNLPFNLGGYNVVKDPTNNNVYAGTSMLKVFTGINDIAGNYSFPGTWYGTEIQQWWRAIDERDYDKIIKIMEQFRINYVIVTKNIPGEVKKSYLFDNEYRSRIQDDNFFSAITDKKLLVSTNGNYELYSAKKRNLLIEGKNVYFQKISPVKYLIHIKDLKQDDHLFFYESFHDGWKLYPSTNWSECASKSNIIFEINNTSECRYNNRLFDLEDLFYLFKRPLFDKTHKVYNQYFNSWVVSSDYKNKNVVSDVTFVLYFMPQSYFYLGTILSALTFFVGFFYLIKTKHE